MEVVVVIFVEVVVMVMVIVEMAEPEILSPECFQVLYGCPVPSVDHVHEVILLRGGRSRQVVAVNLAQSGFKKSQFRL